MNGRSVGYTGVGILKVTSNGLRQQSIARRAEIKVRKRFSPLRANMLFVSINFSLEKDSVVFSAFVNYNVMLCIEFPSLRLKCDMGEVF